LGLHDEHRRRFRERVKNSGAAALADHELLEGVLFPLIPRKDTNELAHVLLERFGGLKKLFDANHNKLGDVEGITDATAVGFELLHELARRLNTAAPAGAYVRSCLQAVETARVQFEETREEALLLMCLSGREKVLDTRIIARGNIFSIAATRRTVLERAYANNAASVILFHNHPSGDPEPSPDDIEFTEGLYVGLMSADISMTDHIILGDKDYYSFNRNGLLQEYYNKYALTINPSQRIADRAKRQTMW